MYTCSVRDSHRISGLGGAHLGGPVPPGGSGRHMFPQKTNALSLIFRHFLVHNYAYPLNSLKSCGNKYQYTICHVSNIIIVIYINYIIRTFQREIVIWGRGGQDCSSSFHINYISVYYIYMYQL